MNPFSVIENKVISKLLMKQLLVMDDIQMIIYKLFLYGSVIPLYMSIDFWTSGITEQMRYAVVASSPCFS